MNRKPIPEKLLNSIYYDPNSPTGLRWAVDTKRTKVGDIAGYLLGKYYRLTFQHSTYACHNVIWEKEKGEIPDGFMVDHKDTIKLNNILDNFRLVTQNQNQHNRNGGKNSTGIKGLYKYPNDSKYNGAISFNGKAYTFRHSNKQTVIDWLLETRRQLHGEHYRD